MITAANITFGYTDIPLYEKGNFTVGKGAKVGLIGPNGAGKSTLFNLILKKDEPFEGSIEVQGRVALVPQEVKHDPELEKAPSIRDYIDPEHHKYDHELEVLCKGLELLNVPLNDKPHNLSGGQKTKLALARALLMQPDILLLDEPTNFMDVEGKRWVMNFLSTYPKTLVVISHDLKLMDTAINKIIAINPYKKTIEEYSGGYTKYIAVKKQQDELLKRQIITDQKHIKQMKKGLEKLARYTSEKGVRQRIQLKKRIQRLEESLPEMPKELRSITVKLPDPAWVGELPVMVKNIYKKYEKPILEDISISIRRGEKIALLGRNGAGKSTFIKILTNNIRADQGQIIYDDKLRIGYYSQEFESLDMDKSVINTIAEISQQNDTVLRPLLARFLLKGDKIFQSVGTLSGGEKTRLSIAILLAQQLNFLVLDEPTTYLDPMSQRIILESLKQYQGTMLIVSHTEDFIKELKPSRVLLLPQNKILPWSEELLEKVSEI